MKIKKIHYDTASVLVERANSEVTYYGAYINGQFVGVVGKRFRAWYATELCHLFVHPEFRKRGVGTALVAYALDKVKTPTALATVVSKNKESERVFLKLGFRQVSTVINPNTGNTVRILIREKK